MPVTESDLDTTYCVVALIDAADVNETNNGPLRVSVFVTVVSAIS